MQQFTVPQFIDVEDKVIGPITVRQFIIILVAAGVIFACHQIFYLTTAIVLTIFILFITVIIAFVKVNGVHFHLFLTNFLITMFKANTRVWNNAFGKEYLRIETEKVVIEDDQPDYHAKQYSSSRLTELSLIVDTQGVFRGSNKENVITPSFTGEVHSRK